MQRSAGNSAALSSGEIAPERSRGAALSIRLSAAIVTATVDQPRALTIRIGREPVEALPSGPLEVEHRTLEVGLRAWVERQTSRGSAMSSSSTPLATVTAPKLARRERAGP